MRRPTLPSLRREVDVKRQRMLINAKMKAVVDGMRRSRYECLLTRVLLRHPSSDLHDYTLLDPVMIVRWQQQAAVSWPGRLVEASNANYGEFLQIVEGLENSEAKHSLHSIQCRLRSFVSKL